MRHAVTWRRAILRGVTDDVSSCLAATPTSPAVDSVSATAPVTPRQRQHTALGMEAEREGMGAWEHTKILLSKNLLLKRQQYLTPTRIYCVPVPLSILIEFVLPLGIIILLSYIKDLSDLVVHPRGWGGDLPQGVHDLNVDCQPGIAYQWERATQPDVDRVTSCSPFVESLTRPEPFWRNLVELHAMPGVKLALAAEDPADVEKVRRMRSWISSEWYPRQNLSDVPCFAGEIVAGDIGWDKGAFDGANMVNNCTHHGTNPGELSSFEDVSVMVGDGTAADLQDYLEGAHYMSPGPRIWAAVVFNHIGGSGEPGERASDWDYSIRMNFTHADSTSTIMSPTRVHMWSTTYYAEQYIMDGFGSLQMLVDRYIIGRRVDTDAAVVLGIHDFDHFKVDGRYEIDLIESLSAAELEQLAEPMRYEPQVVQFLAMPEESWRKNGFYSIVRAIFALVYVLIFMYSVFGIIATLVEEKETRMRELLRMMSVSNGALISSWYLTYAYVFAILSALIVGASSIGNDVGVFSFSSVVLLFMFFFLFSLSAIAYAFLAHTFFDKAKTGGVVGMLMFFSCYFTYTAFRTDETPVVIKEWISILSPAGFAFGLDQLVLREEIEEGIQWANADEPVDGKYSGISFAWVCFMLLFDTVHTPPCTIRHLCDRGYLTGTVVCTYPPLPVRYAICVTEGILHGRLSVHTHPSLYDTPSV
jgi:hypothetical protein